jgi:hypothetical protein
MKNKFAKLSPPQDGTTYELQEIYLENKPGEPAEFSLFMYRVTGKRVERFIHTLDAATREEATEMMREIADRPDVVLIDEHRKPMEKQWEKEQESNSEKQSS